MGNKLSRKMPTKGKNKTKKEKKCNYDIQNKVINNEQNKTNLDIEIYGAQIDPTEEKPWECAKQSVIKLFLKENNNVMFFDDSKDNTDAAIELLDDFPDNLDVEQVRAPRKYSGIQNAGTLVSDAETVMWEHIERNPKYNVIIFDFDFTISDKHSQGTTLKAIGNKWNEITVNVDGKDIPFMNTEERYNQLIKNLTKLSSTKKLVILSRGGLSELVNAFTKMNFNVTKAVGMSFDKKKDGIDIILTSNDPKTLLSKDEKDNTNDDEDKSGFEFNFSDSEGGSKKYNKTRKRKHRRKIIKKKKGKKHKTKKRRRKK